MLPCRRAMVHAAEYPAILRRRHVARNLAIAESLTLLLHLRLHLPADGRAMFCRTFP
jgi:hypothetical protein